MSSLMRWSLRLLLLPALWAGVLARPVAAQEVKWRDDYKKAREEAQQTGRPLLLDLGTENCTWCKQLDQTTFRDPALVTLLNERFIPLKIDGDRSPSLVEALRVQKYPTLVFATANGAILGYQEGYVDAPTLREQLHKTLMAVFTPEWMVRDLKAATEAVENGEYARAITLLRDLVEDGKDRPVQAQARQLLKELEEQAATRFALARQMADRGQNTEAVDAVNQLVKNFPGTRAAREGSQMLFTLASRVNANDPQRAQRARELLSQAKEDYRAQRFLCCLERCDALSTSFADLPEGAEASQVLAEIQGNPEWLKQATEQLGDRLGTLYLALADAWLKRGQPQQAVYYLERVVQAFPNSRQAETAQARLAQLQGQLRLGK
jgi:thioredoxin-like negative regulator of GroEL